MGNFAAKKRLENEASSSHVTTINDKVTAGPDNHSEIEIHVPVLDQGPVSFVDDSCSENSFVFVNHPRKDWSSSVSSAEDAAVWSDRKISPDENPIREEDPKNAVSKHVPHNAQSSDGSAGITEGVEKDLDQAVNVNVGSSPKVQSAKNHSSHTNPNSEVDPTSSRGEKQGGSNKPDYILSNEESKTEKQHWIKVTGSTLALNDYYDIFSNYGCVSALAETTDACFIKFTNWMGVANVLKDVKNLMDTLKFESIQSGENEIAEVDPGRREIYLGLPSFVLAYLKSYEELSKMLHVVAVTANDNFCLNTPKIQQLCDYIRAKISKDYPQSRLYPFGSCILGSCENYVPIDIFVDVGNMYAGCHKQSNEDQVKISKDIRKLLTEDVTWYSPEESPVGIFSHKYIGVNCILSYNNGLGDRSTQLLRVFMDYDERCRVLYLALDVWCRQCSLQGVKNGLNSYILASLVVFYLQAPSVLMLPSIHRIRTNRPVVIKGWDCSFIEDPNMLPRNDCTAGLHSLLRGFFLFYSSYDWKRVVSPVLGHSLERTILSDPSVPFPDDPMLASYCRSVHEKHPNTPVFDVNTCMCVQDFFNLSENISKGVSPDILLRFRSLCRQSYKMLYNVESRIGAQDMYHPMNERRLHSLPVSNGHPVQVRPMVENTVNIPRRWEPASLNDSYMMQATWKLPHGRGCVCEYCRFYSPPAVQHSWNNGARWPHPPRYFPVCQNHHEYGNRNHDGYRFYDGSSSYAPRGAHRENIRRLEQSNTGPRFQGSYDVRYNNGRHCRERGGFRSKQWNRTGESRNRGGYS